MDKPWHEMTALELGAAVAVGTIDALALTEHFLDRIARMDEDHAIYIRATAERALAEAGAAGERARQGLSRGPLDGVPISWKDLFDAAGTVTTNGSPLFADSVAALDAKVLVRATHAGMVCLGKTTMSEFAYSGLGINPTMGMPVNCFDNETRRSPGGSSSGAAASVANGLAAAAIGSDTGGSVRIPAAWHGLVGLKTTYGALPLKGVVPLWPSVDTVGPLTRDVADAAALFAVLAARPALDLNGASLAGVPLLVPTNMLWDEAEAGVVEAIEDAIGRLEGAGAVVTRAEIPEFHAVGEASAAIGKLMSGEVYGLWREALEAHPDRVFPPTLARFRGGRDQAAPDSSAMRQRLAGLARDYLARTAPYAAVLAPTSVITPPAIADVEDGGETYAATNIRTLKNTRIGNLFGLCALTLPCGSADGLPVGLMLYGAPGCDAELLRLAAAAETALAAAAPEPAFPHPAT